MAGGSGEAKRVTRECAAVAPDNRNRVFPAGGVTGECTLGSDPAALRPGCLSEQFWEVPTAWGQRAPVLHGMSANLPAQLAHLGFPSSLPLDSILARFQLHPHPKNGDGTIRMSRV